MRRMWLRFQLLGLLPRCHSNGRDDPDDGYHCWGLIWPWQDTIGPMHSKCRARNA
jgi:hypothetical protein